MGPKPVITEQDVSTHPLTYVIVAWMMSLLVVSFVVIPEFIAAMRFPRSYAVGTLTIAVLSVIGALSVDSLPFMSLTTNLAFVAGGVSAGLFAAASERNYEMMTS